jgi:hypothetical protein
MTVGIVLVYLPNQKWRAFIAPSTNGYDEEAAAKWIADNGAALSPNEARPFFPFRNLKDEDWHR